MPHPPKRKRSSRYLWTCPDCSRRYRVKVGHFPDRCPACQTYREASPPDPPEWFKRRTAGGGRKFFLEHHGQPEGETHPEAQPLPASLAEPDRDLRVIRYYERKAAGALCWIPLLAACCGIGAVAFFISDRAGLEYWQGLACTWLGIGILVFLFLPTIVAVFREHHNSVPIFIVNALMFWTGIGWIVALIWAFTSQPTVQHHHHS